MRILQHIPLRAQIPQDSLTPGNVLIQRGIGARKEVLLPERMLLSRHALVPSSCCCTSTRTADADPGPAARVSRVQAAPAATCRRGAGVVGVLGGGDVTPALAQQLAAVLGVQGLVAADFEGIDLLAVGGQLGAEVADALVGFFLLGRVELLLGERVVLVNGLLEGRQRRAEGAEGRGAEEVVGAAAAGVRGRREGVAGRGDGGILVRGREVGKVFADGCALLERTVEGCVLRGMAMRRQYMASSSAMHACADWLTMMRLLVNTNWSYVRRRGVLWQ